MKSPYEIVKRPIITEKSMELIEDNKYTFEVDKNANKAEIKKATSVYLTSPAPLRHPPKII